MAPALTFCQFLLRLLLLWLRIFAYSRSCSGFDLLPILGPGRELVATHYDLDITYQLVGRPIGFGATLKHIRGRLILFLTRSSTFISCNGLKIKCSLLPVILLFLDASLSAASPSHMGHICSIDYQWLLCLK